MPFPPLLEYRYGIGVSRPWMNIAGGTLLILEKGNEPRLIQTCFTQLWCV